jgi:hypothetical protein
MIELLLIFIENTHAILILNITPGPEVRDTERHARWCFASECNLDFRLLAFRVHIYLPVHFPMAMRESRGTLAEYVLVYQVRRLVEDHRARRPVG